MLKFFLMHMRKTILKKRKKVRFQKHVEIYDAVSFEGSNLLAAKSCVQNCSLGFASYIGMESQIINCDIGRYTCIGPRVHTVIGRHPTREFVSLHPAFFSLQKQVGFSFVNRNKFEEFHPVDQNGYSIHIGSDVWIGADVLILDGVTIGDGAIVGARALVNKDIPPYAIVEGVPAKIVRYRFTETEIEELQRIKWWEKDFTWIEKHAEDFDNIRKFLSNLEE